ncbi:MAG: hypothetical protein IJ094_07920 [Bacilli bacterium]|nr:hypothetical protein [Bacilli bacterium]
MVVIISLKEYIKNGNNIKAVVKVNQNKIIMYRVTYQNNQYIATDLKTKKETYIKDIDKFLNKIEIWRDLKEV